MSAPSDRRGFLRGLATLPLIGGGVTLTGNPVRAAVPVTDAVMLRYVAFLAAEHRDAVAQYLRRTFDQGTLSTEERVRVAPLYWFPPDASVDDVQGSALPSTRAAVILSAAGIPFA